MKNMKKLICRYCTFLSAIFAISTVYCLDSDHVCQSLQVAKEVERFDEKSTHYFYLDPESLSQDFMRVCVPLAYPNWFAVPASSIHSVEELGTEVLEAQKLLKVDIRFKHEFSQLNTVLEAYRELVIGEQDLTDSENMGFGFKWNWKPPWTWSRCAKCKLKVNISVTAIVAAAAAAAGTTGPGALAVIQPLIIGAYGVAAWEAVKAVVFSASVSELSRRICKKTGECN